MARDKDGENYRRKVYVWITYKEYGYDGQIDPAGVARVDTNLKAIWEYIDKFYYAPKCLGAGNLWHLIESYSVFVKRFRMAEQIMLQMRERKGSLKHFKIEMHLIS